MTGRINQLEPREQKLHATLHDLDDKTSNNLTEKERNLTEKERRDATSELADVEHRLAADRDLLWR